MSAAIHMTMVLTFQDTSYYGDEDDDDDDDGLEDEDYEKDLSVNLDKSQGLVS